MLFVIYHETDKYHNEFFGAYSKIEIVQLF